MQTKIIIVLISISIFSFLQVFSLSAQTKYWKLVDSISFNGFAPQYIAISCTDTNNCIAVMDLGGQLYDRVTSDGGRTWSFTLQDTTILLYDSSGKFLKILYAPNRPLDISYPDTNLCVITCDSGVYWHSTDKGLSWKKDTIIPDLMMGPISMPNAKFGIVQANFLGINTLSRLFKTNDNAKSWQEIPINVLDSAKTATFYAGSFAIDSLNYRIIGYKKDSTSYLFGTEDGGKNWIYYSTFPILKTPTNAQFVYFLSKTNGWAVATRDYSENKCTDMILHTLDGGYTWKIVLDTIFPSNANGLRKIVFSDSIHGTAFGVFGRIWRTSDGGVHWEYEDNLIAGPRDCTFYDIAMPSATTVYACDAIAGRIYKYSPFLTHVQEFLAEPNNLFLFPNPSTDFIEIAGLAENENWEIFNVLGLKMAVGQTSLSVNPNPTEGQTFLSVLNSQGGQTRMSNLLRIDVSAFPSGVYFLRAGGKVRKFLKF